MSPTVSEKVASYLESLLMEIVGLSRVQSRERPALSPPKTAEGKQSNGIPNGLHKTRSTAHDHQPFTEHELALAMQRTRLEVPAQ